MDVPVGRSIVPVSNKQVPAMIAGGLSLAADYAGDRLMRSPGVSRPADRPDFDRIAGVCQITACRMVGNVMMH